MATGHNPLGANAYTRSTPVPDLAHLAAQNFSKGVPVIMDSAVKKDWKYFEDAIINAEAFTGQLLKEYKDGGAWKEHYKTWGAACVPLNLSRSQVNRLIANETSITEDGASCATQPYKQDKKEEAALKKVEEAQSPNMGKWAKKVLAFIDHMPKSKIHNKLSPENIKVFESSIDSLRLMLVELLPQKPVKELCKCGCGLSAVVADTLFKVGVPCAGLTVGQAGLVMSKLAQNEWRLPRHFEFLKNAGEWKERQWLGKPENKGKTQ